MAVVEEAPEIARPKEPSPATSTITNSQLSDTWISLNDWSQGKGYSLAQSTQQPALYALQTSNGLFELSTDGRAARWEGAELRLGFPLKMTNGLLWINEMDLRKNIEPLSSPFPLPIGSKTIVIDAGHGGSSPGTTSVLGLGAEKTYALDWALRLQTLLERSGWRVFQTRTNDVDVALSARVAFANEIGADLFISLHFNSAAPSREQNGLETFCLTPQGMPSTLTRGYEDNAGLTFPNNTFDEDNLKFAMTVHRSILKIAGPADRGVRRARFMAVLRGQNRPAILVEAGYLSNPKEAEAIASPQYRQKLAEAIAAALVSLDTAKQPALPPQTPPRTDISTQ